LDNDAPYVQDGTRLPKEQRDELKLLQLEYLKSQNITVQFVTGESWEERTKKAITIIKNFLKSFNYES
jgi:HTH-type transcriptional repressor of NAD biosynthesis genes